MNASSCFVDYYQVLGVTPAASQDEIQAAFRDRIRQWHPDKHHGASARELEQAHAQTCLILEAKHILLEPEHRVEYDEVWKSQNRHTQRSSRSQRWEHIQEEARTKARYEAESTWSVFADILSVVFAGFSEALRESRDPPKAQAEEPVEDFYSWWENQKRGNALLVKVIEQGKFVGDDRATAYAFITDSSPHLRWLGHIILETALGDTEVEAVVSVAKKLLDDENHEPRRAALNVLYRIDSAKWDEYADKMREDPDYDNRRLVASLSAERDRMRRKRCWRGVVIFVLAQISFAALVVIVCDMAVWW